MQIFMTQVNIYALPSFTIIFSGLIMLLCDVKSTKHWQWNFSPGYLVWYQVHEEDVLNLKWVWSKEASNYSFPEQTKNDQILTWIPHVALRCVPMAKSSAGLWCLLKGSVWGVLTHVYAYTPVDLYNDLCEELSAKRIKGIHHSELP